MGIAQVSSSTTSATTSVVPPVGAQRSTPATPVSAKIGINPSMVANALAEKNKQQQQQQQKRLFFLHYNLINSRENLSVSISQNQKIFSKPTPATP